MHVCVSQCEYRIGYVGSNQSSHVESGCCSPSCAVFRALPYPPLVGFDSTSYEFFMLIILCGLDIRVSFGIFEHLTSLY